MGNTECWSRVEKCCGETTTPLKKRQRFHPDNKLVNINFYGHSKRPPTRKISSSKTLPESDKRYRGLVSYQN